MRLKEFVVAGLTVASLCSAQGVTMSGEVTDTTGVALPGAVVRLEAGGQSTTTDADGKFTVTGPSNVSRQLDHSSRQNPSALLRNGVLRLNVPERSRVEVAAFSMQGRTLAVVEQEMSAGSHAIALTGGKSEVRVCRIRTAAGTTVLKYRSVGAQATPSILGSSATCLTKQTSAAAPINDVLAITNTGYVNYRMRVTNPDTSGMVIRMIAGAGTLTDADGNVYQTVRLGNQIWMAENLRTTKYNDGTPITLDTSTASWRTATTARFCYYNSTTNADSIRTFGALYNWYAVTAPTFAPAGWHVPTSAECDTLRDYMIVHGYNWDETTADNLIAKSLAARTDWNASTIPGAAGNDLTTNNRSGFSAVAAGSRQSIGYFYAAGSYAYWWNVTEYNKDYAYYRSLCADNPGFDRMYYFKNCGLSVRLLKD